MKVPGTKVAREARRTGGAPDRPSLHAEHSDELVEVARLEAPSTQEFRMLGVTWAEPAQGDGLHVQVRSHDGSAWTDWSELPVHEHDEGARAEGVRGGTDPMWVGSAEGIDVRVLSAEGTAPDDLRVDLIDPGTGPDLQSMSVTSPAAMPKIIGRKQWGADPRLRSNCSPAKGPTVKAVTIHHTVNANNYTKGQSDDIIRGIYAYHTQSQGWCDIGYNFLIDRFGQIFEGRAGGVRLPIRGAHAGDWDVNEQSTGISLIGNFETATPTTAMKNALVRLVSWRLETYYRGPNGSVTLGGKRLPTIMGHRNVKSTACPGRHVYNWLPTLRKRVTERMGDWHNGIYRKWQNLGGESGWVGSPRRGEMSQSGGRNTIFDGAVIYHTARTGAHEVHGSILDGAYRRTGGAAGLLGFPTSDVKKTTAKDAQRSTFENGVIYASPRTGSHEIHGPVYDAYARQGWTTGPLGLPTSDVVEATAGDAARSSFQGGAIYHSKDTGTNALHGPVYTAYARQGWTTGPLGLPTSGVVATTDKDGTRASFQGGVIYQRADVGAHALYGPIYQAYAKQGWTTGELGLPTSGIASTTKGGGQVASFVGGAIYSHKDLGAHAVSGEFFAAYARQRWTTGPLGLPMSDVRAAGAPRSTNMRFQGGYVYYRSDVGAHSVHGRILKRYTQLRGAAGRLGLPTTDVRHVEAGLRSDFEGGWIRWNESTDTFTVHYR